MQRLYTEAILRHRLPSWDPGDCKGIQRPSQSLSLPPACPHSPQAKEEVSCGHPPEQEERQPPQLGALSFPPLPLLPPAGPGQGSLGKVGSGSLFFPNPDPINALLCALSSERAELQQAKGQALMVGFQHSAAGWSCGVCLHVCACARRVGKGS